MTVTRFTVGNWSEYCGTFEGIRKKRRRHQRVSKNGRDDGELSACLEDTHLSLKYLKLVKSNTQTWKRIAVLVLSLVLPAYEHRGTRFTCNKVTLAAMIGVVR